MPTSVIHVRDIQPADVYIGRAVPRRGFKASIWQNPFRLGKDGDRDTIMAQYRTYLDSRPDLLDRIPELTGKRLACWCAPDACHGDILAALADT